MPPNKKYDAATYARMSKQQKTWLWEDRKKKGPRNDGQAARIAAVVRQVLQEESGASRRQISAVGKKRHKESDDDDAEEDSDADADTKMGANKSNPSLTKTRRSKRK